jgi:MerR family transcriptional regulator, redox-sensitive transcriptional activator SoxR
LTEPQRKTSTSLEVKAMTRSAAPQPHALSAGQLARRSGVAVSTIHFYEAQRLISSTRTAGNQRRYPRTVLRRVAVIRVAQRLGLPLAAIRSAMDSLPGGRTPNAADWRRLSALWRADLDRRIGMLQKLARELDGCIGCGCLSLKVCQLRNADDALAQSGPGARLLEREIRGASRTAKG